MVGTSLRSFAHPTRLRSRIHANCTALKCDEIFPRGLAPRCYRWPRQKRARTGFQPLALDREGTAMRRILAGAIAVVCLSPVALRAEVIRFDIVERVPAFAGRSFGDVGPYERIIARATIALNPSDERNAVITDLPPAPRNPDGKVEATADVVILRPADPARGNGTLLLDVPNRGRKLAPQLFDDSSQPGANN